VRRVVLATVLAAAFVVSCGGDDDSGAGVVGSGPGTAATTTEPDTDATEPDADATTLPETMAPETTEPPETVPTEAVLALPDADVVVQTTPTSGGGTRPLLGWEPFEGAATYLVIVYAEGGEPYWSTITEQTETFVGGAAQIPDGVDGPEVAEGYSWAVYAEDADGIPIASSPIRPISP
jgi:hypothetical protein